MPWPQACLGNFSQVSVARESAQEGKGLWNLTLPIPFKIHSGFGISHTWNDNRWAGERTPGDKELAPLPLSFLGSPLPSALPRCLKLMWCAHMCFKSHLYSLFQLHNSYLFQLVQHQKLENDLTILLYIKVQIIGSISPYLNSPCSYCLLNTPTSKSLYFGQYREGIRG